MRLIVNRYVGAKIGKGFDVAKHSGGYLPHKVAMRGETGKTCPFCNPDFAIYTYLYL